MIKESGRVVSVEKDHLWIQTIRKSACATCSAEKGCGQAVLAKWGQEPGFIRVELDGRDANRYGINDTVTIAIGEDVLLKTSLILYLVPLFALMTGISLGYLAGLTEGLTVLSGVFGLAVGAWLTRYLLSYFGKNQSLEPVLVDDDESPVYWAEPVNH